MSGKYDKRKMPETEFKTKFRRELYDVLVETLKTYGISQKRIIDEMIDFYHVVRVKIVKKKS